MVSAHSFGKTASIHIELRENEQILERKSVANSSKNRCALSNPCVVSRI